MSIKVGLAGDLMIGRLVNDQLLHKKEHLIWGDLLPLLQSTDLNFINLEVALTHSEQSVPKVFNFKSDPANVRQLTLGNIHAVNLANNHVLDFDVEGLLETLSTLDSASILHVGAGKDLQEAEKPLILQKGGVTFGILGYTDNEPSWIAGKGKPGIYYISAKEVDKVINAVSRVRDKVDILIASQHFGPNMVERPSREFITFAHTLIDHGVDIIHSHSAHIFQGVEKYKKGLILYDTGDFVDDYYVDPDLRNDCSFFFVVDLDKSGLKKLHLYPVLISGFQVHLATGTNKLKTMARMKLLSSEFGTHFEEDASGLLLTLS